MNSKLRWRDAVRVVVLARLLPLNAERSTEEVALGLHSKAGRQAAKAPQGQPAGRDWGRSQ